MTESPETEIDTQIPEWVEWSLRREQHSFQDLMFCAQRAGLDAMERRDIQKRLGNVETAAQINADVGQFFAIATIMELIYFDGETGGNPRKDYFAPIVQRWIKGRPPKGGWGSARS